MLAGSFARMVRPGAGVGERLELAVSFNQPDDGGAGAWLHLVEGNLAHDLVALVAPSQGVGGRGCGKAVPSRATTNGNLRIGPSSSAGEPTRLAGP